MNGKVRAFNGDMGMAMSVFKDMVGKVRFVFADPPYKITQARYDKPGWIGGNTKIANLIVLSNLLAIFFLSYYISYLPLSKYQLASSPDSSLFLPPKKNPIVMPLVINQ